MPLPPGVRLRTVVDAIDPLKDIDGIHPLNAGLLRLGYEGFVPATAHAALEMIHRSGVAIEGADAVVIGRSPVVGHAARVHADEGGRDGHGLPLEDPRPRRQGPAAPTSSSSRRASRAS